MEVYDSILDVIGNTPMVRVPKLNRGLGPTILAKVEGFNPGGSIKDRIGLAMIEDAEQRGLLKRGGTIIEPTSGNTGAGLAIVAAIKGYKSIFVMADKQSTDKVNVLKAFGAEVVITPTAVPHGSPQSYTSVAKRLSEEIPGAFLPDQYYNMNNPEAHYATTGPEIWRQTDGKIDVLVASVGTGGTITGVARYLKEQNPNILIVGADPEGSIYTSGIQQPKTYKQEGIGQDFYPDTLDRSLVDEWIMVTDKDAFNMARRITREEGILVGESCGTAMWAGLEVAKRFGEDKLIVVILPDTGRNYLSKLYNDAWMRENGLLDRYPIQAHVADLMVEHTTLPPLISVCSAASVREAVEVMHKYEISQMPVIAMPADEQHSSGHQHGGQVGIGVQDKLIGSIQEKTLLESIFRDPANLNTAVEKWMESPFPIVSSDEDIDRVLPMLLNGTSTVLVEEGDRPTAIITRTDLLEYVVNSKGAPWQR